jgi:hypothetical protein
MKLIIDAMKLTIISKNFRFSIPEYQQSNMINKGLKPLLKAVLTISWR